VVDARRDIAQEKAFAIIAQAEMEGLSLEAPEFTTRLYESLSGELAFAKLSAATVAAFVGQDPSTAFQTSTIAVENNAIVLAVGAGLTMYAAYDAYKTYEQEGAAAALKKVGVETVFAYTGTKAAQMVWKIGGKIYPTAELAWQAYMISNPTFAHVASKIIVPLKQGASKAKYIYLRADEALSSLWSKGMQKLGFRSGRSTTVDALDLATGHHRQAKGSERLQIQKELLPGEGKVGTYKELQKIRQKGDNLTPHHMPQSAYMEKKGIVSQNGVCMMMEHPYPGTGGRHRSTFTYGKQPDMSLNPREQLARDIFDARTIYQRHNLYTSEISQALKKVIRKNKESFPNLYKKIDGVIK